MHVGCGTSEGKRGKVEGVKFVIYRSKKVKSNRKEEEDVEEDLKK